MRVGSIRPKAGRTSVHTFSHVLNQNKILPSIFPKKILEGLSLGRFWAILCCRQYYFQSLGLSDFPPEPLRS